MKPNVLRSLAASTQSTDPHLRLLFEIICARSEIFIRLTFLAGVAKKLVETFQGVLLQALDVSHRTVDENHSVVSGYRRKTKRMTPQVGPL